ncbi:uncharacterized protein LOC112506354 [Cynara cardunculus var. scolymus]|uniref:Uncharacterized protein n=1 Tax=Cynara cardunculus var. scolymus TaxID=59895 RepID=A0A118K6C2_CYNCS|nr:uncharacterized protein LOC112506354 [Cynara cardunculus var. scolymus]KVI10453.1 hypothetical protein Ccrd_011127 [Cynara cardunculus var. scolymus]
MVEEEHTPKCSNSGSGGGGGGRSSKKLKHKKVPQRGMGVAQLEKIILEEQQKKDVGILTPNSIISPATSSSCLANIQSVPNFRPPLVPLPPPLPPNHQPLIPRTDGVNPSFVSKPMHTSSDGGNNWSRSSTGGEYRFHGENPNPNPNPNQNRGLDHRGFTAATAMPTNLVGLPYESNPPIWPPHSNIAQRSQPFQQPCSSSMVNVSLGTTSSSSVMNFQMEPPSNQSYCGNNYPPLWPDEDKMIGMKRSYPFSMENMPIPSFNCKFPFSPISRPDESTSCSNGGTTSLEPSNPSFRETPSSLGAMTDQMTKKLIDENHGLTKDFLTLAPPRASHSSLKEKMVQTHKNPSGGEWPNQQPLHSFFPAAKTPGTSNGEAVEHVDLNLKL